MIKIIKKIGYVKNCVGFILITSLLLSVLNCKSNENFAAYNTRSVLSNFDCYTEPMGVVDKSQPLTINIQAGSSYNGRILQKISGPISLENTVVYDGSSRTSTLEGRAANKVIIDKVGKYKINLSTLDHGLSQTGYCSFEVVDPCPISKTRQGMNLVVAIDNSGSHGTTDCQEKDRQIVKEGVNDYKEYICLKETSREKAVKAIVRKLAEVHNDQNPISKSSIAFTIFPQDLDAIVNTNTSLWYDPNTEKEVIANELKILRSPKYNTPYGQGLSNALKLFALAPHPNKPKVLLFITDGYPDDDDPRSTLALAQSLKDESVKILVSMIIDENSQVTLKNQHLNFIKKYIKDGNKRLPAHYSSNLALYFRDLLGDDTQDFKGLVWNIASQDPVFVKDIDDLEFVTSSMISIDSMECVN